MILSVGAILAFGATLVLGCSCAWVLLLSLSSCGGPQGEHANGDGDGGDDDAENKFSQPPAPAPSCPGMKYPVGGEPLTSTNISCILRVKMEKVLACVLILGKVPNRIYCTCLLGNTRRAKLEFNIGELVPSCEHGT